MVRYWKHLQKHSQDSFALSIMSDYSATLLPYNHSIMNLSGCRDSVRVEPPQNNAPLPAVETTAPQPQKSLCDSKRPDVTVIAEIKCSDLIPITFAEMSPERVRLMYRTGEGIGCGDNRATTTG